MGENRPPQKKRPGSASRSAGKSGAQSDELLRTLKDDFAVEEVDVTAVPLPTGSREPDAKALRRLALSNWWIGTRRALGAVILAMIAVVAGLVTRGALPVDETRFLAIAWEMWTRHDLVVPHLNGAPVAMPPLFFWAVYGGWSLLGPAEWWARSVPVLFMLGSLFLSVRMARFLWPGQKDIPRYLPFVLLGTFSWLLSATFFAPFMAMVFGVLFAQMTLLWMWRTRDQRVWPLLGLGIGVAMLGGGSLALLYILPVAFVAPMWSRGTPVMPWRYWYADLFKALLVGFLVFGVWFLLAAGRAKSAAVMPLLTSPLAMQSLDVFVGNRPVWWPLFLLPFLALPWSFWPLPWTRFLGAGGGAFNHGVRFCFFWAVPAIAVLVLVHNAQPQFLLPLVPAFVLPVAWALLDDANQRGHDSHLSTMIFPLMAVGGMLAVLPKLPRVAYLPDFLWTLSPFVGVAVIVLGVAVGLLPLPDLRSRIRNMTTIVTLFATFALLALGFQYKTKFDSSTIAGHISTEQQAGHAVAMVGAYAGEFQFAGQLRQPIVVLAPDAVATWLGENPQGLVVTVSSGWQPSTLARSDFEQEWGDARLRMWRASTLAPATPPVPAANPAQP